LRTTNFDMENKNISLKTEDGEPFEVPQGGSLGLLALGYVGLMLWREKRQKIENDKLKPEDS